MITPLALVIVATSLASLLVGIAIGRLKLWDKVDEAKDRIKAEVIAEIEREKRVTAESLASELSTIRDGIISTAEAYGRVVKVVEDKLGGSDKLYLNREGEQKVISVDITKHSVSETTAPEVASLGSQGVMTYASSQEIAKVREESSSVLDVLSGGDKKGYVISESAISDDDSAGA